MPSSGGGGRGGQGLGEHCLSEPSSLNPTQDPQGGLSRGLTIKRWLFHFLPSCHPLHPAENSKEACESSPNNTPHQSLTLYTVYTEVGLTLRHMHIHDVVWSGFHVAPFVPVCHRFPPLLLGSSMGNYKGHCYLGGWGVKSPGSDHCH